ncbi:MAG: hypothetical protein AAGA03_14975, partial [Planctomycetota bacterium]
TAHSVSPSRPPNAQRTGWPLANRYQAWPSEKAGNIASVSTAHSVSPSQPPTAQRTGRPLAKRYQA